MIKLNRDSKILVTGASGYLGREILLHLNNAGYHHLTGISRHELPATDQVTNTEYLCIDILDVLGLEDVFTGMDVVIHTAGMVSYQPSDKNQIFKVNVEGTANAVNSALTSGVKLFIHISSSSVFGIPTQQQVIDENYIPEPTQFITDYALSKWYGELEVWRSMKEGLQACILCPSIIVGPTSREKNTDIFIHAVKNGLSKCPSGGSGFVDHRDICRVIELVLEKGIIDRKFILSATNLSWSEFFKGIAKRVNMPANFQQISKLQFRTLKLLNFLKKLMGIKATVPTSMAEHMMQNLAYNGSLVTGELGFTYTPFDQTMQEYCQATLHRN